jgi:serine/threonine protein kinase
VSEDRSKDPAAAVQPTLPATGEARLPAGDRIAGRYEVLSPLGRGGMGAVYRVRDHELEEIVALKLLHHGLVQAAEPLVRFRKEVKLARRVTHRNVARTFDIGEHQGERFLTMELIEGEPLSTLLERSGPLDVARALEIARQMAEGMAAAHDAGVVHRDLKPENVSIASDGRVVLMDFGIARANLADDTLQTSGQTWGTPAYMAPEQVEARSDIDARADIYAFGAVLYEMLTGRLAWGGSSAYVVAAARLTSPPPDPRAHRPELSAALAALVAKCMARDRAERFEDARALLRGLDALASSQASATLSTEPRSASDAPLSQRFVRRQGTDGLREDIAQQLVLMGNASPSYRRALQELDALLASEESGPLTAAFERVWQKRDFEGPFERPLLVLAALRADARAEGATHPLHAALADDAPDDRAVTTEALRAAIEPGRIGFWITLRSRRIQTNEVTRSLAWLWPATLAGAGARARPLLLFDVGASAGLNLVGESVDVPWRRSTGEALTISRDLDVRERWGFDPRPLDVRRPDDCEWLRACIWPGQLDRLARLDSAIAAFRATLPAPEIVLSRASSVPGRVEEATKKRPGQLAIAYQTLVRGYVPKGELAAYEEGMRSWLAAGARGERVWALLELEELGRPELSCALDVHVGTGGGVEVVRLGRTSYHPHTVEVAETAEQRLAELLR